MKNFECFKKHQTKIWIRHVVVPGITDSEDHMAQLKAYIQTIPNVEKVELLPYHLLGTNKYKVMDIPYSLEGVPAMDKKKTEMLQQTYFDHVYFMEENHVKRMEWIQRWCLDKRNQCKKFYTENYTLYEGDDSFLADVSQKTKKSGINAKNCLLKN